MDYVFVNFNGVEVVDVYVEDIWLGVVCVGCYVVWLDLGDLFEFCVVVGSVGGDFVESV